MIELSKTRKKEKKTAQPLSMGNSEVFLDILIIMMKLLAGYTQSDCMNHTIFEIYELKTTGHMIGERFHRSA